MLLLLVLGLLQTNWTTAALPVWYLPSMTSRSTSLPTSTSSPAKSSDRISFKVISIHVSLVFGPPVFISNCLGVHTSKISMPPGFKARTTLARMNILSHRWWHVAEDRHDSIPLVFADVVFLQICYDKLAHMHSQVKVPWPCCRSSCMCPRGSQEHGWLTVRLRWSNRQNI